MYVALIIETSGSAGAVDGVDGVGSSEGGKFSLPVLW